MKFYETVFGWNFNKMEMPEPTEEQMVRLKEMMGELSEEEMQYWLISTGPEDKPGIGGGLSKRRKPLGESGYNGVIITIEVENIDEMTKKVQDAGGKIVMPKMAITGVGYQAQFEDPEQNILGMIEMDKTAQF